jgi:putative spermidine/putrescine transport system ATP-binding protein
VMEGGQMTQVDAPYRLYEQPSNAFISSFVGKTNLLPGTWRRDGASGAVEIAGVLLEASAPEIAPGAPVTLSIRPEKILLREAGTGRLEGRVASRFFLGSQWLFTVETPLGTVTVSTPNQGGEPPAEGSSVSLDWSPANLRVIASTAAAA